MGERSPQRFFNGSSSYGYRLSHGLHTVPSSFAIGESKMTEFKMADLSLSLCPQQAAAIPFIAPNRNQQYQQHQNQQQQQQLQQHQQSGNNSNHGGARFLSYFGNEDKERKKSETSFFNLGFRRKSTIFFAATD
ncbi:uncharacterized protein LOC129609358 isoform X2 [Condylostylus longicornis]|nr:uncharacterized protein LOC129609358 isoform X2 [Condylostylus longicornis]